MRRCNASKQTLDSAFEIWQSISTPRPLGHETPSSLIKPVTWTILVRVGPTNFPGNLTFGYMRERLR
jgi:hypothetical protein